MKPLTLFDKFVLFLATGFGSGYSPIAPGTAGSIVGVAFFCLLHGSPTAYLAATVAFTLIGMPVSTRAEILLNEKDSKKIVIDEIAGQLIALYMAPFTLVAVLAGFALFRLFDVSKVWPVNRMEELPAGYGVMMDDIVAGFFALAILQIFLYYLNHIG
jgi:phosphatidylglycerophosphatase A